MLGCWADNILDGLAIYSTPDQAEQLWIMKKNKVSKIVEDESEIENLKKTQEYLQLEQFYEMLKKNPDYNC